MAGQVGLVPEASQRVGSGGGTFWYGSWGLNLIGLGGTYGSLEATPRYPREGLPAGGVAFGLRLTVGSRVAATVAGSGAAYRAAKLDDLCGHAATDADPPRLALS
jgi:hypothetical protein